MQQIIFLALINEETPMIIFRRVFKNLFNGTIYEVWFNPNISKFQVNIFNFYTIKSNCFDKNSFKICALHVKHGLYSENTAVFWVLFKSQWKRLHCAYICIHYWTYLPPSITRVSFNVSFINKYFFWQIFEKFEIFTLWVLY